MTVTKSKSIDWITVEQCRLKAVTDNKNGVSEV